MKLLKINKMIKRNLPILIIVSGILFVGYLLMQASINTKNILNHPKFTIAQITSEWHHKNDRGIGYDYEYLVNNDKYEGSINIRIKNGEKYLVIYDSIKPQNAVILEFYLLPKDLPIPINGWRYDEVPIKIDSIKIKELFEEFDIGY